MHHSLGNVRQACACGCKSSSVCAHDSAATTAASGTMARARRRTRDTDFARAARKAIAAIVATIAAIEALAIGDADAGRPPQRILIRHLATVVVASARCSPVARARYGMAIGASTARYGSGRQGSELMLAACQWCSSNPIRGCACALTCWSSSARAKSPAPAFAPRVRTARSC